MSTAILVINLSHPFSDRDLESIAGLTSLPVGRVVDATVDLSSSRQLGEQVHQLLDGLPLSPRQWQQEALVVNLPGLAVAAAAVLADIHGRRGSFPRVLRMERNPDSDEFQVVEVVSLQSVRDGARRMRTPKVAS